MWVSAAAVSSVLLAGALAGAVDEPMITPVDGKFQFEGRGFGHGRGMSQWGAQGAAVQGFSHRQILARYYPGTEFAADDLRKRMRVLITADRDGDLKVAAVPGLVARRGTVAKALPEKLRGSPVTKWRVRLEQGRLEVAGRAGAWIPYRVGNSAAVDHVRFYTSPSRGVRLILPKHKRDYRGDLRAYRDPTTGKLAVVNGVRLEAYLRSVVPSESWSNWRQAALRAQSVAARTYARWRARNVPLAGGVADICDTTACQVYHGVRRLNLDGRVTRVWEAASTDAAIEATAGQYLTYAGKEAFTEFSAANGGWSTAGDVPYQVARRDPWDGVVDSAAHSWRAEVRVATLNRRFPRIGRVIGLVVRDRDGNGRWGGRILSVRVVGESGFEIVPGTTFAKAAGLRHSWWRALDGMSTPGPTPTPTSPARPPLPIVPTLPPTLPPSQPR